MCFSQQDTQSMMMTAMQLKIDPWGRKCTILTRATNIDPPERTIITSKRVDIQDSLCMKMCKCRCFSLQGKQHTRMILCLS